MKKRFLRGKKTAVLLIIIGISLPLSGCGLRSQAREVEQLLVIQTMGLDSSPIGVRLSLASGAGVNAAGSPTRLHGSGSSITTAIERIRSGTNEEDLFCAHIGHVLIGEAAARQGIESYLDYICRSHDLRISVPVYIVKGGTAEESVMTVGSSSYGICDALASVLGDVEPRGDGHVFTAADIAGSLARNDCALICAVERIPSAEKKLGSGDEEPNSSGGEADSGASPSQPEEDAPEQIYTVTAAGYAVVKDGRLIEFIPREQAIGVNLVLDDAGICELTIRDRAGFPVTLELQSGSRRLSTHWGKDGLPESLEINVSVEASLAENGGESALDPLEYEGYLTGQLEKALSARIGSALQLSKSLGADFMDLEALVEQEDPGRYAALTTPFSELWQQLPVTVSVSAKLTHTGDVR